MRPIDALIIVCATEGAASRPDSTAMAASAEAEVWPATRDRAQPAAACGG
ncbi:hypothetical protein ME763_35935 [Streptomyces murinus]|nr:hypothetical protein [Streptomyces murinus]WDO10604.1 hypothetical protein ME763_35935 [Streptomyces murinus]